MTQIDPIMVRTWREQITLADETLEEIAQGRTARPYAAWEIAEIRAERARFVALVAAAEAEDA